MHSLLGSSALLLHINMERMKPMKPPMLWDRSGERQSDRVPPLEAAMRCLDVMGSRPLPASIRTRGTAGAFAPMDLEYVMALIGQWNVSDPSSHLDVQGRTIGVSRDLG